MIILALVPTSCGEVARPFPRGRVDERLHRLVYETPGLAWSSAESGWRGYADAIDAFARKAQAAGIVQVVDKRVAKAPGNGASENDGPLRDYQREGVRFLTAHAAEGAILADDVGLGKTVQALRAAQHAGARTVAVVCPKVVRGVWEAEVRKWSAYEPVGVDPRRPARDLLHDCARVLITHYDVAHAVSLPPCDVAVFDEAHYLMNGESRRSRACRAIVAPMRLALTATPLTIRPRSLWNIIDTISPGRVGKFWQFARVYCDAHQETIMTHDGPRTVWNLDGASRTDELAARLAQFVLRRSKTDVMAELPPRERQIVYVDPGCPQALQGVRDGLALGRALSSAGVHKVADAAELARCRQVEGHGVVVFSHLRATAEAIGARTGATVLTGETIAEERARVVATLRAQAHAGGPPPIVSATIDAIGVGIDLSFADVGIFADLDWVPTKLLQAEGRLHRSGQTRSVLFYYLIARGTADEIVERSVVARLALFEEIIGHADEAHTLRRDLGGERQAEADVLAALRRACTEGRVTHE